MEKIELSESTLVVEHEDRLIDYGVIRTYYNHPNFLWLQIVRCQDVSFGLQGITYTDVSLCTKRRGLDKIKYNGIYTIDQVHQLLIYDSKYNPSRKNPDSLGFFDTVKGWFK